MVKKRSFWTGIGLGLALGAVLLQMMMIGKAGLASPDDTEVANVDTVSKHAERLGYTLYASDQEWVSKDELENRLAEAREEAMESVEPEKIVSVEKSMYILPGMNPGQVADMLIALSLIEDKQQFIEEIKSRQLQGKIQTGVTKFTEDLNVDDIIELLISK